MAIVFDCACGNSLRSNETHVGRRLTCPACGGAVTVPNQDGVPLPAAQGSSTGSARRLTRRSLLLQGSAAVVLLGLASTLFVKYALPRFEEPPIPDVPPLELIPRDAQSFLTVRPADICASLSDNGALDTQQVEAVEHRLHGLTLPLLPQQVERVTLIGLDDKQTALLRVVTATEPLDQSAILQVLGDSEKRKYHGISYHFAVVRGQREIAIYFPDRRTFVTGDEAMVERIIDTLERPKKEGPMDEGLRLAEDNGHHVVAAYEMTPVVRNFLVAHLDPQAQPIAQKLLSTHRGILTARVAKETQVDLLAEYDEKQCKPALRLAQAVRKSADAFAESIAQWLVESIFKPRSKLIPEAEVQVADALRALAEKVDLVDEGTRLHVRATPDTATIVKLLGVPPNEGGALQFSVQGGEFRPGANKKNP